jgi:poly(hydroxyalkanoate) granule-associated protein
MAELARTLVLASVGAAALTKDKTQDLASRLVERGAQVRHEAQRMAEGAAESVARRTNEQAEQGQARIGRRMEGVLGRMNVPTREDIIAVNAKLSVLSAKVDALLAQQGSGESRAASADIDPSAQI